MTKVTFNVICAFDPEHKFPVVYEMKNDSEGLTDSRQEFCPYCGKLVNVKVQGKFKEDGTVHRMLGFKND